MKIVLFLLDAYKEEYLAETNTPFLYNLANAGKHIEKIIPSAGFCERTEIFFGLKPKESDFFTAIGFDPENSPYEGAVLLNLIGFAEKVVGILTFLLSKKKKNTIEYFTRKLLLQLFYCFNKNDKKLNAYNIPFSFLKYFNLTEDEFDLHKIDRLSNNDSIFKIVSELKGETYMGAFTALGQEPNGDDENRINLAIEACRKKVNFFIPVYISAPDSFGHMYGPNSKEIKKELNKLDVLLEESILKFLKIDKNTKFLFLGDHGMTSVTCTIDINLEISKISKKHKLKEERDYIYFLDSTLLRMWFFNNKSKEIFYNEINENPLFFERGKIINKIIADKYHLPIDNRKYGDISWWANEGVLIYPDFFHKSKIMNGMHGYRPDTQSTYGTCVIWYKGINKEKIKQLELSQIYDEIINLLKK
jgi:predicted AlkP superfamily pyrophosphatase or phosphodiesterase